MKVKNFGVDWYIPYEMAADSVLIGLTSLQSHSFGFLTASNHVIIGWNYGFVPFGPF